MNNSVYHESGLEQGDDLFVQPKNPRRKERLPMCCFTGSVDYVKSTQIFARDSGQGKQYLVYDMDYAANDDLAMVLPLPVPPHPAEDAVRFIDLEGSPNFFIDLLKLFADPILMSSGSALGGAFTRRLAVIDVGAFEASFVPTIADFARLDEKFRLPSGVWESLPQYKQFGFAVFKLRKKVATGRGYIKKHPMAFEFPRTNPDNLFFPTVHIHDGKFHPRAEFDHSLYAQLEPGALNRLENWKKSHCPAGELIDVGKYQGLVDENAHVFEQKVRGIRQNQDFYV